MPRRKKQYRLQFAYRGVVERVVTVDTPEEALKIAREEEFLKENPILAEGWDECDGRVELLGITEDEPGWRFIEDDRK